MSGKLENFAAASSPLKVRAAESINKYDLVAISSSGVVKGYIGANNQGFAVADFDIDEFVSVYPIGSIIQVTLSEPAAMNDKLAPSNTPGQLQIADINSVEIWGVCIADIESDNTVKIRIPYIQGAAITEEGGLAFLPYSTGVYSGLEISINGSDNTKFDLAAGIAYIVDDYTDPTQPIIQRIDYPGATGISVTYLSVAFATYLLLDWDDVLEQPVIIQQYIVPTREQVRENVVLGILAHTNLTNLTGAKNTLNWLQDQSLKLSDVLVSLGTSYWMSGVEYSANGANLNIDRSAGELFLQGGVYATNKKSPNFNPVASSTALTFVAGYHGATGSVLVPSASIDTAYYNPGTGLTAIPDGGVVAHRVYYEVLTDTTIVQYGQFLYDSIKNAVDSIDKESFIILPEIYQTLLRTVIIVEKNATDLSDDLQANFVNVGKFGEKTWNQIPNFSEFGEPVELIDGMSYQKQDTTVLNDSGTLYLDIEALGGGDITYIFLQKKYILNCTTGSGVDGKARVALTAGASASSPTQNFVYVTRSGSSAVLNASTSRPTGEFAYVGVYLLPDATTFSTTGVYVSQEYTDAKEFGGRGSVQRTNERIRILDAVYDNGIGQTVTVNTTPSPDSVDVTVTSGEVWQKHIQSFPSLQISIDGAYIVNHPTTPYYYITDLNDSNALQTSDGTTLSDTRFNWVLWGVINKSTGECKLMINLPSGSYGTDLNAVNDINSTAVTTVPKEFRGVAFLIARLPFRHQANLGGQYTNLAPTYLGTQTKSLLGVPIGYNVGGAGSSAVNEFNDSLFKIYDNTDTTKFMQFQASSITTATTRTYTAIDRDGELGIIDSAAFRPTADNNRTCGSASYRWSEVYAAIGTINTSDIRLKNTINKIDNRLLNAISQLNPVTFYFNENSKGLHIGFIAQEVEEIFKLNKLDIDEFYILNKEGEYYGLAYNEFIAGLLAYSQSLDARIINIENKLGINK